MTRRPEEPASIQKEGGQEEESRKRRHIRKQLELGFTRANVKCHVEDIPKIKKYAANLLAKRLDKT